MRPVDPVSFRRAMSRLPTGVAVLTTRHVGGGGCGLTANAFTSVSLSPPLVLACVDRAAATYGCVKASGVFAVSFLSADQHRISVRFAERRDDKLRTVPHRIGELGAPIIEGAGGFVECEVEAAYPGGDHEILLGRVVGAGMAETLPLVFFHGGYTTVAEPVASEEREGDAPPGRGRLE